MRLCSAHRAKNRATAACRRPAAGVSALLLGGRWLCRPPAGGGHSISAGLPCGSSSAQLPSFEGYSLEHNARGLPAQTSKTALFL